MKPPKHFVKAVAVDLDGKILAQVVLTPPMGPTEAYAYREWIISNAGLTFKNHMVYSMYERAKDAYQIVFMVFETTLY